MACNVFKRDCSGKFHVDVSEEGQTRSCPQLAGGWSQDFAWVRVRVHMVKISLGVIAHQVSLGQVKLGKVRAWAQ